MNNFKVNRKSLYLTVVYGVKGVIILSAQVTDMFTAFQKDKWNKTEAGLPEQQNH